jgi:hypothetical protein
VPRQTFFEYIESDEPLDVFLDHFPDVARDHAEAVSRLSKSALIAELTILAVAA